MQRGVEGCVLRVASGWLQAALVCTTQNPGGVVTTRISVSAENVNPN